MPSKALWHAELALLPSGVVPRVLIEVEGERISALTPDTDPPPSPSRLPAFTLPGLANAHSHAFHRALRGRTQRERGDFWSWRRRMYELAGRLDPESYLALATAVYAEMTLAGVTAVGEFHYIHHDQEGRRYADPNEMGLALAAAASKAGIRLTLIDTCYLRGDLKGRPLEGPQLRFGDGDASTWAERVGKLQAGPTMRIAAGIHSLGATRTTVCMCPTTERDLADGIGPAAALATVGSPLCVGSDSHAVIDLFEESRALELDECLASGRRGHHCPAALLAAATTGGMAAIGWRDAGRLQTGALADFATLDLGSPRLAGARPEDLIDHVVFAATAADVTHVVIGGRPVVEQRCHVALGDVGQALAKAIRALDEPQPVQPASRTILQRPRT